jgi:hypothetical protein
LPKLWFHHSSFLHAVSKWSAAILLARDSDIETQTQAVATAQHRGSMLRTVPVRIPLEIMFEAFSDSDGFTAYSCGASHILVIIVARYFVCNA